MILSMLSRGLGRMVVTTKSTTEIFGDLAVLQKKIQKMCDGCAPSGTNLWSTRPEGRNTILGPKSAQK